MKKLIFTILLLLPFNVFAMKVGVISDIHAGKMNIRKTKVSIVYPKLGVRYFDKALAEMNGKVDLVVVLGDITQSGEKKYYQQLKRVELKRGTKVIWIKGNHDDNDFNILGGYEEYNLHGITLTHIPPLEYMTCNPLRKIEGEIWAGHWHIEKDCGNVKIFPALTEHKKLTYRIINL